MIKRFIKKIFPRRYRLLKSPIHRLASFDEGYYLRRYPDVKEAVLRGQYALGLEHFYTVGQFEGRRPNALWKIIFPQAGMTKSSEKGRFFPSTNLDLLIPSSLNPELSIVMDGSDVHQNIFLLLSSLLREKLDSFEIIIVNGQDKEGMKRVQGLKMISLEKGQSFFEKTVEIVKGTYILFLAGEIRLFAKSVSSALEVMKSSERMGAVGAKIMDARGVLLEAGGVISQQGLCESRGFGDLPFRSQYLYKKEVDFFSPSFFLTRKDFLMKYQEALARDWVGYCLRLQKDGWEIVYHPSSMVVYFGESFLQSQKKFQPPVRKIQNKKRILYLDDRIPHIFLGSGFPRTNVILKLMVQMGYFVTFYPKTDSYEKLPRIYQDIPLEAELVVDRELTHFEKFLSGRKGFYDILFVSRPHNMQTIQELRQKNPDLFRNLKIIYDAEAVFGLRKVREMELKGKHFSEEEVKKMISKEIEITKNCDAVISVSEKEASLFRNQGCRDVHVLGHAVEVLPTPPSFHERKNFLFVGPLNYCHSPNADAVLWFSQKIFPLVLKSLSEEVNFTRVGYNQCRIIERLKHSRIRQLPRIEDLKATYDAFKIFVVPTRFSAGIPLKVLEAAAHGIPVVATPLVAEQLGWKNGYELLVGQDEQRFAEQCVRLYQDEKLWNHIRQNALHRVQQDCSMENFSGRLKMVLEETLNSVRV
ncbi:MAG: glycosyltransferase [Chlamydiae bacterium]|nr:glycosyltransferase [Chlamydiota bacterium]MBI3267253.1 glycosyltransferase [Chlamydiota bacterium]